jgi:two-component system cell cycle response regulator DivK
MTPSRILVVDDEPKLVRLVREVLTGTGYAVMSTGRGEDAIQMAALEQPDLIVLDLVVLRSTVAISASIWHAIV